MNSVSDLQRYARQLALPEIGEDGQRKLLESSVVVIGCGALGTHMADSLVRAGVGHIRIIDRDFVELNNLQRQVLFDENDVTSGIPKSVAAANKLKNVNSHIVVDAVVDDVNPDNIERLTKNASLIFDGTDNFETRMLINDICLRDDIPWVYGGVIGTTGMSQVVIPGKTSCFRCLVPALPPPGTTETCETAGVLSAAAAVVAAIEVTEGMKLLLTPLKKGSSDLRPEFT